jgi:mono/diheme cytochrome c family protein
MPGFTDRCRLRGRWLLPGVALLAGAAVCVAADTPAPAPRAIPSADFPPFGSLSAETDGRRLYETICQGCHMSDAKGAQGAGRYPALAANPKLGSPAYPEYIVLNGLRAMPDIGRHLSDAQVAAVVNYVITHFGNTATDAATPAEVAALRANPPLR